MENFDGNEALRDALSAMTTLHPPWWSVLVLVALVMAPILIGSASKAIAEHRKLSHQREEGLLKIRNSIQDRRVERARVIRADATQLPPPRSRRDR